MTLDQVCIDDDVSQKIKTNIIDYINSEQLDIKRLNNLPTKRGIIFVGDPGQGKTHVSRALANTLNTTFMVVSRFSQGAQVDSIFNFLRSFDRAVVLFEDIDIYLRDRNDSDNEVLSTFLNQLDGIETNTHLIVILTTNDIDVLDKAIKNRPGRFDCTIKFKSPSIETKVKILQTLCADQIVKEITPEDFKNIIEQLPPTYSPAQLRDFHISTCILAIEKNQIDENKKVILTKEIFVEISNKTKTENNSKPIVGFHNDAA
jgi:ATP-dependent 26S proteasome regulatory subunit